MEEGDKVKPGDLTGFVGMVLNSEKIDAFCPLYIRKLKNKNPVCSVLKSGRMNPLRLTGIISEATGLVKKNLKT